MQHRRHCDQWWKRRSTLEDSVREVVVERKQVLAWRQQERLQQWSDRKLEGVCFASMFEAS